jgi:hypothetical protein
VWRAWLRASRTRLAGISRGSVAAYFAATLFVALAGSVRWAIGFLGPETVPFATFYSTTFFATIVGGVGPGIFAALLGAVFYAGSFRAVRSTGIFRKRLPVAAKIALATAGTMAEVPHSPIPPGGSRFCTM